MSYELRIKRKNLKKTIIVNPGETVNLETVSVFDKPRQKGNVLVKAVVLENGTLNLKGIIKIKKRAELTEAFLRQKVLLVGGGAKATAVPELEIECNEVRASHAATVGRLDEEQIYYLMSRGISRPEAVGMIIKAFLED